MSKILKLYIAEKPSVARAIAEAYAAMTSQSVQRHEGYLVVGDIYITWCVGHMLELCEPHEYDEAFRKWDIHLLPFVPENWKHKIKEACAKQVSIVLGLLAQKPAKIVNAGDAEREGQLLVDELLFYYGVDAFASHVDRIWLSSVVQADVIKAIKSEFPNSRKRNLFDAAYLRQRADYVHGLNYTRFITRLRNIWVETNGKRKGVVQSVGRVQTPTLSLVVERDREIANFKPVDHYQVLLNTVHSNGSFKSKWLPSPEINGLDSEGRLVDARVANELIAKVSGKIGRVSKYATTGKFASAPLPFSLSALQQECSKRFALTAAETLEVAQALYEAGVTTYPRTDSRHLPVSVLTEQAPGILSTLSGSSVYSGIVQNANKGLKSKAFDDSKVSDHHGIIPTTECHLSAIQRLSPVQQKVFDLIARTFIAQFYPDQTWTAVEANVDIEGEAFRATGKVPTAGGWTVVFGKSDVEDDETNVDTKDGADDQPIPEMANGDQVSAAGAEIASKRTTPPAPFNDGTLIGAMTNVHRFVTDPDIKKDLRDNDGLGTEATRANIIENLISPRGFLVRQGKKIVSTDSGRDLIGYLSEDLKSPGMTALLERDLKLIETNGGVPEAYLQKMKASMKERMIAIGGPDVLNSPVEKPKVEIEPLPGHGEKCASCKKGTMQTRLVQKDGPNKGKRFLGCSNFAGGGKTMIWPKDSSGSGFRAETADNQNVDGPKCKKCGIGVMVERFSKKSGKKFLGCNNWRANDPTSCDAVDWLNEPSYRPPRPKFG